MSDSPRPAQTFVLRARPPVRALAISSVAGLVGAVLMVGSRALDLPTVVVVVGAIALVLALVLLTAALLLTMRLTTRVALAELGVQISRGSRSREIAWSDITGVDLAATHLVLHTRAGDDAEVVTPRGTADPVVTKLSQALREALDTDRGYRDLPPN